MLPASKSKNWATQAMDDSMNEPPSKILALEVPEGESDGEYEAVPKKSRQESSPKTIVPTTTAAPESAAIDEVMANSTAPDATDDDWLRGRTNRLLDLMDPDDIPASTSGMPSADVDSMAETMADPLEPMDAETTPIAEQHDEESHVEKPDPIIEAMQSNGRLFVRNLPYTATEDDLRKHFEPYGALEEVRDILFCYSFLSLS